MTTQALTQTDFLMARIAEEEAWWRGGGASARDCQECGALSDHEPDRPTVDRLLADIEAKRRIVEDFEDYASEYRKAPSDFAAGRRHAALLAVTRAAAVYADHPDYRDEWRP